MSDWFYIFLLQNIASTCIICLWETAYWRGHLRQRIGTNIRTFWRGLVMPCCCYVWCCVHSCNWYGLLHFATVGVGMRLIHFLMTNWPSKDAIVASLRNVHMFTNIIPSHVVTESNLQASLHEDSQIASSSLQDDTELHTLSKDIPAIKVDGTHRSFYLPTGVELGDCTMFYIGGESLTLTNILMTYNKCQVCHFFYWEPPVRSLRLILVIFFHCIDNSSCTVLTLIRRLLGKRLSA